MHFRDEFHQNTLPSLIMEVGLYRQNLLSAKLLTSRYSFKHFPLKNVQNEIFQKVIV